MTSIRVHLFQPDDSATDWRGQPGCALCPLPKGHEIHRLPEVPDEVRKAEARRVGEGG